MQPPPDEVKPGAPEWVVTFGDMMSLLLTFFVLLLSFSSTEASKFKMIAGYMREAFGLQAEESYSGVPMGTTILSTDARRQRESAEELNLVQNIRKEMEKAGVTKRSSVTITERGVSLRLEGELVFASGSAELRPEVLPLLDQIAGIALQRAERLDIEGHTDNLPIRNKQFPSNWELSSARAGSTARHMISNNVPPSRVRAVGYADTEPISANDTPDNRALNRRVEFVFLRIENDVTPVLAMPLDSQPNNQGE